MPMSQSLWSVLPVHPLVFLLLTLAAVVSRFVLVKGLRSQGHEDALGNPAMLTLSDALAFRVWPKNELPQLWKMIGRLYGVLWFAGIASFLMIVLSILIHATLHSTSAP